MKWCNRILTKLYLQLLAAIYFFSFLSFYVQWPGLYGDDGVLPLGDYMTNLHSHFKSQQQDLLGMFIKIPSAFVVCDLLGVSTAAMGDFLMLSGMLCSCLIIQWKCPRFLVPILFALTWLCYLSVITVGQTFATFQWDGLLLEIGFLGIFVALGDVIVPYNALNIPLLGCRFLAWKLMFSAGVVKLSANCPTWNALTALEYHFATQPLPTALAWVAHQLPPVLLRLGVGITLVIEIPLTFMLLAPSAFCRRVGVFAQLSLQLMILVTGNYNFFNILTMVLMIPCYMEDVTTELLKEEAEDEDEGKGNKGKICWKLGACVDIFDNILWVVALIVGMAWWMLEWVPLGSDPEKVGLWDRYAVSLRVKWPQLQPLMLGSCALAVAYVLTHCICQSLVGVYICWCKKKTHRGIGLWVSTALSLALCAFTVVWVSVAAVPLNEFDSRVLVGNPLQQVSVSVYHSVQPFRVVSGYGLFRVMTGVGGYASQYSNDPRGGRPDPQWGSLGLHPTIVARPELVFEGRCAQTGRWLEIPFLYKPTSPHQRPLYVLPHQPRLDWQLWFAALGAYNSNPWLVHLVYKLLTADSGNGNGNGVCDSNHRNCPSDITVCDSNHRNCPSDITGIHSSSDAVLNLLDKRAFRRLFNGSAPVEVRITKYEYDFTRINTSWSQRIPGVHIVDGGDRNAPYWYRKNPTEYFPGITKDNPSVLNFLRGNGISVLDPEIGGSGDAARRNPCQTAGAEDIYLYNAARTLVCSSVLVRRVMESTLSLSLQAQESIGHALPGLRGLFHMPYEFESHSNTYLRWDWVCCGLWPVLLLQSVVWLLDKVDGVLAM